MNSKLDQHLAQFKEQGFTVFERVFDEPTMAAWRAKFHQMQADGVGGGQGTGEAAAWWYGDMLEYAPGLMLPAVNHPLLMDFAELVLGPFVQLDNLTFAAFPPADANTKKGAVSGWHRDRWSHLPTGQGYERPLAINAIAYLQDLTDDYGPLRVVPGSHLDPTSYPRDLRNQPHPQEKLVRMKAGDVVFVHNGLLHSGTANATDKPRYFFSIYYNLTWLRHTDSHQGPNTQRILRKAKAQNDHRLMRLLGVDEQREYRTNCGFLEADEERWAKWSQADREAIKTSV